MSEHPATFRTWPAGQGLVLIVITTPNSVTITHRRETKKLTAQLNEAYNTGTLGQLVEQDAKFKKDTVYVPTEILHIPGNDKLWVVSADQTRKQFASTVFSHQGAHVAEFIGQELLAGQPVTSRSLREIPNLRRPWVLFPIGMGTFMAITLVAVRIVAGLFGDEGRRPVAAEAARSVPMVIFIVVAVALLALGAFQTMKRSKSDQQISVYA